MNKKKRPGRKAEQRLVVLLPSRPFLSVRPVIRENENQTGTLQKVLTNLSGTCRINTTGT